MARRQLTDSEREQRAERMAALSAAAQTIEEGRAVNIDQAIAGALAKYSRKNVALILAQCDERGRGVPQAVAGFHEWRKAGRIVRKGAKGLAIYAPVMRKGHDENDERRTGYTIRYVFDVIDTDPLAADSPATLRELSADDRTAALLS